MSDIVQLVPNCIDANPDIAGIGVRSAIYAQNFMTLYLALYALDDDHVSETELQVAEAQATSILLTACALLISAFVQAKTLGMSTYHAIVVLNLAWMNNTNTFTCFVLFMYDSGLGLSRHKVKNVPTIPLILGSLHLSFLAGFGLWFWATVDTFGAAAQCAPRLPIFLRILGRGVAVTNRALRVVSLTIYATIAVPVLNVMVLGGIIIACVSFLAWVPCWLGNMLLSRVAQPLGQQPLSPRRRELWWSLISLVSVEASSLSRALRGHLSLLLLLGVNIAIVVDTEAMVKQTRPFVKPGESEWTFGQTLALLLLSLPLLEFMRSFVKQAREERARGSALQTSLDTVMSVLRFLDV